MKETYKYENSCERAYQTLRSEVLRCFYMQEDIKRGCKKYTYEQAFTIDRKFPTGMGIRRATYRVVWEMFERSMFFSKGDGNYLNYLHEFKECLRDDHKVVMDKNSYTSDRIELKSNGKDCFPFNYYWSKQWTDKFNIFHLCGMDPEAFIIFESQMFNEEDKERMKEIFLKGAVGHRNRFLIYLGH